jgi:hypothetical protein
MKRATLTLLLILLLAAGARSAARQKAAAARLVTRAVIAPIVAMQRGAGLTSERTFHPAAVPVAAAAQPLLVRVRRAPAADTIAASPCSARERFAVYVVERGTSATRRPV